MIAPLIRTLRPRQWAKNVFVAAPLVFARHLADPGYLARAALATLAFCALTGAVYAFNDVRDIEADRQHPTKRHRPIASGELSVRVALGAALVLAVGALAGSALLSWELAGIAAIYLVQNVLYSIWLKQIAFVDVSVIAAGFLLRVFAGATAIAVAPSRWLLLCTALLALLLGLGKRAHELQWARNRGHATRAALAGYRIGVVRVAMLVLAIVTCGTFAAYAVAPHTIAFFGTTRLVYITPFVVFGVARFLRLAIGSPRPEPPTDAMLRDPLFVMNLLAAAALTVGFIYG